MKLETDTSKISAVSLRWFDGATVTDGGDTKDNTDKIEENADPLQTAIDEVHRALIDYGVEMDD